MDSKKILLVEDEELMRKLVRNYLKKDGYNIVEAADGMNAIKTFFNEEDISLVLLDIMLPVYDGFTVCREIRKFSKVPITMITAKGEDSDQLLGFEIGATASGDMITLEG